MIWTRTPILEELNKTGENGLPQHLGITFTEVGDDYLKATMPVDHRTVQPMRLLHGGASVVLAETLGSVAGVMCLPQPDKQTVVGVEINANHMNSAKEGELVTGIVRPLKVGKRIHVWEIKIYRSDEKLICVSRITIAVVGRL
ncbi:MAG: hotdog fold thioesterase [Bacteroidota bacterium]